jgi:hypothetical protein
MHQCEEFRERITEHIIDREDLSASPEFQRDLLLCSSCSDFYAESREMIEAISSVEFEISEARWDAMSDRLRTRIEMEHPVATVAAIQDRRNTRVRRAPLHWGEFAAVAALLLITIGLYRIAIPQLPIPSVPTEYAYVDHGLPLDPVTVDFLEDSELLLRHVMKIEPDDVEDLADAKKTASAQLVAIDQRKEAAAVVPPVLSVMETYEAVLRDIRNLDDQSPADDITDIQNRIQNNALIANMKAFQPTVSVVNVSLR